MYAKGKQPDSEATQCMFHLYDFLEKVKLWSKKTDWWLPGSGVGGRGSLQRPMRGLGGGE